MGRRAVEVQAFLSEKMPGLCLTEIIRYNKKTAELEVVVRNAAARHRKVAIDWPPKPY
jgi:hypothetical protein